MKRIRFTSLSFCIVGFLVTCLRAEGPQDVLPVKLSEGALALHGDWKFKYMPSSEIGGDNTFFQPTFDVAAFSDSRPANA